MKKLIIAVVILIAAGFGLYFLSLDKPETQYDRSVDFFYSPECPHCQAIKPLVDSLKQEYTWKWTYHDVTKEKSDVSAVPLIQIKTSDKRNIELIGSAEIERWLECELAEQSSEQCPTYTGDYNHQTNSWFVR